MIRTPSIGLCALALLASQVASAQTNGTWIGTAAGNWSAAGNWQGGTIPDAGGIATFGDSQGQTAGFTVTVDTTSRTLSEIRVDSSYSYTIASIGGAAINMSGAGLTLNGVNALISSPSVFFTTANTISATIAGAGDLVKTGQGNFALTGVNTFTGNVIVNQGTLWLNGGDASLGNLANGVTLNGGVLGVNTAGGITTNRTITVGAGGGTLQTFTALTLSGQLTGSGTLFRQIANGAVTLTGASAGFSGALMLDSGTTTLSGNGLIGAGAAVNLSGTLTLDNSGTNLADRLSGRQIISRGGTLNYTGNGLAASTETSANLTLAQGHSAFTLTPNLGQSSTLTFTNLTRQNNAVLFVRANGLGSAPTANVGNLVFTNSPGTLIGGGGDPNASTTASILPFMYGNTSSAGTNDSTFVTWDSSTGRIVPINVATGYNTNILTAGALENVNQNASAVINSNVTVNSLRLAPTAAITLSGTGTINVGSGGVLNTSSTASQATISAGLTAGANELVLISTSGTSSTSGLQVTGVISGTGGLTRAGIGTMVIGGANAYTGATNLLSGITYLNGGTISNDGATASAFGTDTSAVGLHGAGPSSTIGTRIWTTAASNVVFNRSLDVYLSHGGFVGVGNGFINSGSLTFNGNVNLINSTGSTLSRFLFLEGGATAANAVTINGVISGNGGLRSNSTTGSYAIVNGNNTYTGPTLLGGAGGTTGTGTAVQALTETWEAGSNTAFGTGTIYVGTLTNTVPLTSVGTLVARGGARTLANNFVLTNGFAAFAGSNAITLNGNMELNGSAVNGSVLDVGANSPVTINGVVSRGGLIKMGAGTLTLNGANNFAGPVYVRDGVLSVATIGNGGTFGNLGGAPSTAVSLNLSGVSPTSIGTLRYTGTGETNNRLFRMFGYGGAIDASGTGALQLTNTGSIATTTFGSITITTVVGQAVYGIGTANAAGFIVGSTVTSPNLPAGTTITEIGNNWIRLSNAATLAGSSTFTLGLPAGLTTRTLTLTGSNTGNNTLSGLIANGTIPTAIVKTGAGTWQLTNANTYTGGTSINGGTLLVSNSTGSGTGTAGVTVGGTGKLGGTGIINGAVIVQNNGTLSPGASPGVLTINNNVNFNAGSTFFVELNGLTPGNTAGNHDQLVVTGAANTITLDTTLAGVTLAGSVGFAPGSSDILRIIDNQSNNAIVGTFAGMAEGSLVSFGFWNANISYVGGTGNDVTLFNFAPVPEPSTLALVAAGSLAAWVVRRRRKTA